MLNSFDHLTLGARCAVAFGVSVVIAAAAYRFKTLDLGGSLAALAVGTSVLGLGGIGTGAALFAFFVSGSVLSKLPAVGAAAYSAETFGAKSGRRDAAQVLANGGVAAICAAASGLLDALQSPLTSAWRAAAIGSLAAAAGDTWASELGVRFGRNPRAILGFAPASAGRSGAVTATGTIASFAGGALVGIAAATAIANPVFVIMWATLAGFIGSTIDSVLGASVQSLWRCMVCERFGELPAHHDEPATLVRGVPFMSNDMVNLAATFAAAALTFLAAL